MLIFFAFGIFQKMVSVTRDYLSLIVASPGISMHGIQVYSLCIHCHEWRDGFKIKDHKQQESCCSSVT